MAKHRYAVAITVNVESIQSVLAVIGSISLFFSRSRNYVPKNNLYIIVISIK